MSDGFRTLPRFLTPQLAKHTFIFGANGFGKTTICAVLRSFQTGNSSHVIGRKTIGAADPVAIELLLENGTVQFNGVAWSARRPTLAIFDGVFVAENVHSGEVVDLDHKRNFYRIIIGDEGVRLVDEDTSLAGESRAKTSEIGVVTKAIQSYVPAEMKLDAFIILPIVADIDAQITKQEQIVEAIRQAAAIKERPALSEISTFHRI